MLFFHYKKQPAIGVYPMLGNPNAIFDAGHPTRSKHGRAKVMLCQPTGGLARLTETFVMADLWGLR